MNHTLASLKAALKTAPAIAAKAKLFRRVEFVALVSNNPPNWLYTSGKPQRYNPAGVQCIYFGEDTNGTRAAYEAIWKGLKGADQPATEFSAVMDLQRVLDLTDGATLDALEVDANDLYKNWRRAKRPTLTQLIGQAVNETKLFSAIRFQSKAGGGRGQVGINFVIFPDCVRSPDSVCILGPTSKPLQKWP